MTLRQPPTGRALTPLLLGALLTGIAAGGFAIVLTGLLRAIQHAAFAYRHGRFYAGVAQAGEPRRLAAVVLSGFVAGLGWWILRRSGGGGRVDVESALSGRRLPLRVTLLGSALQIVTVGLGAPLGREGAPREAGAAAGEFSAMRLTLAPQQRRLLLAAGSAAGLAAVYNVPVGGAVLALESILHSRRPRDIVVVAVASVTATLFSWLGLPDQPTYAVPHLRVTLSLCVFALLIGPIAGVLSAWFTVTMIRARSRALTGRRAVAASTLVGAAVGGLAAWQPQLLGNGKGPVQLALDHAVAVVPLLALLLLRPLVTAATLRAGVVGGLLTPALASGSLLGALLGSGWNNLWPGSAFAALVLITAVAFLSGAQGAPLAAVVLGVELTDSGLSLALPLALATLGAAVCSRHVVRGRQESAGPTIDI